jgi:hypothetical protein
MRTRTPKPWIVSAPFLLIGDLGDVGDCSRPCDAAAKMNPDSCGLRSGYFRLARGEAVRHKFLVLYNLRVLIGSAKKH